MSQDLTTNSHLATQLTNSPIIQNESSKDIPARLLARDPNTTCNTFINVQDILFDLATIRSAMDTRSNKVVKDMLDRWGSSLYALTMTDPTESQLLVASDGVTPLSLSTNPLSTTDESPVVDNNQQENTDKKENQ